MMTEEFTKATTAADRMLVKAIELAGRAQFLRDQILTGETENVPFPAEMVRESLRACEFWLSQIEEAVAK